MPGNPEALAQSGHIIDSFFAALARKDLGGARACCAPGAIFWHSFDGVAQDLEQAAQGWQGLFTLFAENRVADVRREPVPGGIVQRHLFLLRGEDGELKGKACCIFVRIEGGLISRLDEYIDLSSDLAVEEGDETTSGLPNVSSVI